MTKSYPKLRKEKAGLYVAHSGTRTFRLRRDESLGGQKRSWTLWEISTEEHPLPGGSRLLDMVIPSIKAGQKALEFVLLVYEHVAKLGATEGEHTAWVLETRLGPLNIKPGGDHIFMRFEDVDRASVELGDTLGNVNSFNPYSGKWNMHWNRDADNEVMFQHFVHRIASVAKQANPDTIG